MAILDIALLAIVGGFVLGGIWLGFIHTLGSLVGVAAGAYVASQYYQPIADWGGFIWGEGNIGKAVTFLLVLTLVSRLIGLGFYLLDRAFEFISVIPFLKSINRLAGGLLGLLEGGLVVGLLIYFLAIYPINDWLAQQLAVSQVASWLVEMAQVIMPFVPEVINKVQTWV